MVNNDVVAIASVHQPCDIPASLAENAGTGFEQDIKQFLAKPIILNYGSFSSSTIFGQIVSFNLADTLFSQEIYKRKLQGFLGIRGKVCLRLQLNATKFQQGRLLLAYYPMGNVQDFNRFDNAMLVTQLPHVQIDIGTQTETVLEVPFVSNYTHFGLVSGEGSWAQVFLYNYLPFRTGLGSTTCDYTIWAHMEDVELVTPTANKGYIAQSSNDRLVKRNRNVSNQESRTMSKGPVSTALSQVSAVAKILEDVPILSSFAAPVAWASQIASSIASVFGWSKPTNELAVERRNITTNQYENNCDAIDNVYSLGLMTSNSVSILPGLGGTDLDEMSMSFLNSVNFYYNSYQWTTSQVVGTQVIAQDLCPSLYLNVGASGLTTFGPLSYMSTMFRYYRGSIKIRLKFAKTMFHSGRLALSYVPGYNSGGFTSNVTLDESAYTYREILDLRDACEYEFTMPYAAVRPYLETTQPYGRFILAVLNPLVAPDTVDSTVDIALEISGDTDFEFFDPQPPIYTPCVAAPVLAQSSSDRISQIHPQKGSIGSSKITGRGTISSELCVGERILSVKQLLARACELVSPFQRDLVNQVIRPFDMLNSVVVTGTGVKVLFNEPDYFTIFSSFYRFSRGGVCIRYQMEADSTQSSQKWNVYKFNDNSTNPDISITTSDIHPCRSHITEATVTGNTVAVRVPMYHPTHARVNVPYLKSSLILPTIRAVEPYTNSQVLSLHTSSAENGKGVVLRSVADDFQLGFFVGIPPMRAISALRS